MSENPEPQARETSKQTAFSTMSAARHRMVEITFFSTALNSAISKRETNETSEQREEQNRTIRNPHESKGRRREEMQSDDLTKGNKNETQQKSETCLKMSQEKENRVRNHRTRRKTLTRLASDSELKMKKEQHFLVSCVVSSF